MKLHTALFTSLALLGLHSAGLAQTAAPATDAAATAATAAAPSASDAALIRSLKAQVAAVARTRKAEQAHLKTFDDLDFNVYSGQKWAELGKSHSANITVHWPDGRVTQGLDAHIEDLKGMFVFAPDTHIKEHPIRIASGEWTAVSGAIEGTFSQPMPIGEGKTIAPTGKSFKLGMVTIGHWTAAGVMDEEWLMWDNQSFMKQIGLAP